ncbi:hypothetical protein CV093_15875 [Oceanobacillus sp. 143]|uniref:Uncharacterized protein n=1 Tax=Oceanobacillus zhaokaii TaxID=2052660 RepID=A0A345PJG5_9BACI|nr:hypothetical protein [Oceanobacillus zhaokaii]AXI10145.1 hypothetical protein CUC15_14930 [Oceanobacillus zhaokaii]QGS69264.1 hypothetical protein CV093_15875 [Oceanobacillus sp. 143]
MGTNNNQQEENQFLILDKIGLIGSVIILIGGAISTTAQAISIQLEQEEVEKTNQKEQEKDMLLLDMRNQLLELQQEIKLLKDTRNNRFPS